MARELQVTVHTVYRWRTGRRQITPKHEDALVALIKRKGQYLMYRPRIAYYEFVAGFNSARFQARIITFDDLVSTLRSNPSLPAMAPASAADPPSRIVGL